MNYQTLPSKLYPVFRSLLFCLPPELAHHLSLRMLRLTHRQGKPHWMGQAPVSDPVTVCGLTFPNRVGMAAGLDKNGDYIDALGSLGFGFLELGTVTPRPQSGNPPPRLFRLPRQRAIINRMGFNNRGADHLVSQVGHCHYNGVIGLNIGKNFDTPIEQAADDYEICLRKVYAVADYVAVNISSPNTSQLRTLQGGGELERLLARLKKVQTELSGPSGETKPLLVKIAPDLDVAGIDHIAKTVMRTGIDGVIATNTTLSREGVESARHGKEAGGLSGQPLKSASTTVIKTLRNCLRPDIPIIGVGGIFSAADAQEKRDAGADLVQIYSGFIYRGPALVHQIASRLAQKG